MKRMFSTMGCSLLAALVLLAAPAAQAGAISDTGTNAYWGSNAHGSGDVIGAAMYDISGATITRVGSVLTITIATAFAGHAGADPWTDPGPVGQAGIAYGDLFLASAWNPKVVAGDTHYLSDNASTGTKWQWGFSLNNRWSNTGGTFQLYNLGGTANAQNILNSEDVLNCSQPCTYRDGQAAQVKTSGSSTAVAQAGKTGTWTVTADQKLTFTLDMTGTSLINLSAFAMHWGETCQNDVIEGFARVVPLPGSAPLLAIGLGAMVWLRRRQGARA
ncbi:VPLPA-CTERM sorting domain-containing protein [Pseudoduganella sp. UC29_71]|uniref:VPLPA-CTERM sorting domain-containing protein n=1 Tax=Pseudoduganella sp. UC29_71 TaxID=3350174 RepID=UPI00366DED67